MDGQSLNIKQTDTARLRELFPGIFSEDKIDPEKFKAAFGDDIDAAPPNERYTLNWAGKADAYRIMQERTAATLRPQVELILKSGYKLTDKVENHSDFYYINNELVVALTKMDQEIAAKIMNLSPKPQKVIVLDRLFAGSDDLKTNTALQMRDVGVGFRTI
jgi:hypothetical protein